MTKRVCILGNSHLAALILGWKQVAADYPDVRVTFFGSAARSMQHLGVSDGALRPETEELARNLAEMEGTPDAVYPDDYDEFWLCGLDLGPRRMMEVYDKTWAEQIVPTQDRLPVSDAMFVEMIRAGMLGSLSLKIHAMLRTITDKPIRVIPQPQPAGPMATWRRALERKDADALAAYLLRAFARLAEDGIEVVPQPVGTLDTPILTHEHLSRGSVRLRAGTPHSSNDVGHMNGDYGATVIEGLLGPRQPMAAAE